MNNNYTSERVSPSGIRIHTDSLVSHLYASMFVDDITCHFSICLSQSFDHHDFYTIDSKDDRLKKLLSFNDYQFMEYDFDKILSSIMHNLIFASKTFVEIAFSKNEKGEIVGISLIPFDAIKIASSKKYSCFLSHRSDKRLSVFKIHKEKYIEFNIKELGLKKNDLIKIVKKLKKINVSSSTNLILDKKMNDKFSFDEFQKKQDFLILNYPKKIGWDRGGNTSLLSESYLLFRQIKLKSFQQKCLSLFIKKINDALNNISNMINASGSITTTASFPEYINEWEKYKDGELSSAGLSKIIFPKS